MSLWCVPNHIVTLSVLVPLLALDETGADETGADVTGAAEVGAAEVGAAEVGAAEVGADVTGADVGVITSDDVTGAGVISS